MVDASLVHPVPAGAALGPRTHVLVIGVGHYSHLPGGGGAPVFKDVVGLDQLTSPPASARGVATWFLERFENPDRPLGTVRLLASEKQPKPFANTKTGAQFALAGTSVAEVEQAVQAWQADAARDPESLAIFYFCGHGLGDFPLLALLCSDFGANPNDPLSAAIDFQRFRNGLRTRAPKYQAYFVDACRVPSDYLDNAGGIAGKWLFTPNALGPKDRLQPTFYATLAGSQAHGDRNKPSYYTRALLEALDGAGAEKAGAVWNVSAARLAAALPICLARMIDDQVANTDQVTAFPVLHQHAVPPDVRVVVRCAPEAAMATAKLRAGEGGAWRKKRAKAKAEPWELSLAAGKVYAFEAQQPNAPPFSTSEYVQPPETPVEIKVGS